MPTPFVISDEGNITIRTVDASGIINTPTITSSDPVWLSASGWSVPWGIESDAAGNLYVCDDGPGVVYKITPSFVLTRVAGSGVNSGPSGIPGPALDARLAEFGDINYLALDSAGNLYISYNGASVILAVNMQGTTQTILGVSIPAGNIDIVAGVLNDLTYSGDTGPATSAGIPSPNGIAVDAAGNLYICSTGLDPSQDGARIRKVDHATGIITTVAGNGTVGWSGDGGAATSAGLGRATGVALDASGNIYITSSYAGPQANVRVVNTQGTTQTILGLSVDAGNIATVAGGSSVGYGGDGGPATSALLGFTVGIGHSGPWASRIDTNGDLYIGDNGNNRIRKVDGLTGIITTVVNTSGVAGYTGDGGPATSATIAGFGFYTEDLALWSPSSPPPGNIIVTKVTIPTGSPPQLFDFIPSWGSPPVAFTLTDGESNDSGPLTSGTYSVVEIPVVGWVTTTSSNPANIVVTAGNTTIVIFTNTRLMRQTLVFDEAAKGWSVDVGSPPFFVHGVDYGASLGTPTSDTVVGCGDGTIRILQADGTEVATTVVATGADNAGDARALKRIGDVFLKAVIEPGSPITLAFYAAQYGVPVGGLLPALLAGGGTLAPYIVDGAGAAIDVQDLEMILSWPTGAGNELDLWQPVLMPIPAAILSRRTDGIAVGKGYQHVYLVNATFAATADVVLTLNTDQGIFTQTWPASGTLAVLTRVMQKMPPNKFKVCEYQIASTSHFTYLDSRSGSGNGADQGRMRF